MAGQKGRSGRKTHYDEMLISEVVNLSIKTVHDYLLDARIPLFRKVMVAKDFALKKMPQRLEGGDRQIVYVINNGNTKGREGNRVNLLPAHKSAEDKV